jgi:hypothetical protein
MVEKLKKPHDFNSFYFLYLILAIFNQQKKGWSGVMAQHVTTKVWGSNLLYCINGIHYFIILKEPWPNRSTSRNPQLQNGIKSAPQVFTFSIYIQEVELGQNHMG